MPIPFDRFRLLNGGRKLRNESEKTILIRPQEGADPIEAPPGAEVDVAYSPEEEAIVEIVEE